MPGMEDDEEEEEAAWLRPESPCGSARNPPTASCHGKWMSTESSQNRIIVHLDLDCFYAQVEMICNPELKGKPLGVQQKYIVVTCNYEARSFGVNKLMSVKEAKEKCPDLLLVNGEDLTKYREMSYKVTALLEEFTPLVERLGFDENFVDITELVDLKLEQWKKDAFSKISFSGHIYNKQTVNLHNPVHIRLAVGSQIAATLREAMYHRLGLTGCAGVASNKLLSKLVSGTFKPNQQTVLLPESHQDLILSLDHIGKVPGIGYKTTKRLMMLGISTVRDLQLCSTVILERELGGSAAQHIQKLSRGEDDSLVTPSGPPQSLSDEDSFKKCSSEAEVKKKVEELLTNLLHRLYKDGRKPHTIRLTLRKFSPTNKWFNRESRQCPIPSHLIQRIGTDDASIKAQLVVILMKLFHKMINVKAPFHLTLLNVCFSNLKAPASNKKSIGFYLTHPSPSSSCEKLTSKLENVNVAEHEIPEYQVEPDDVLSGGRNTGNIPAHGESCGLPKQPGIPEFPLHVLPPDIDYDVFNQLPEEIKEEIINGQKDKGDPAATLLYQTLPSTKEKPVNKTQNRMCFASFHSPNTHQNISTCDMAPAKEESAENTSVTNHTGTMDAKNSPLAQASHSCPFIPEEQKDPNDKDFLDGGWKEGSEMVLPPTIDPRTFSELPEEVQKELLEEWKGETHVSKMQSSKIHNKLKEKKKSLPSPPQHNSLLRYFKPK
uniref:DNA polymerase iota n=1 Tax=Anolis carolinensis TaxID=28377 RepID=H9G3F1_ANOCA|nr:PREDICTED: DNA polymerase iota [Anolis carolinensis]|eukprot:XP_016850726.1 PREDICTED: DNA polymerase iota [Anolis carolinensis]